MKRNRFVFECRKHRRDHSLTFRKTDAFRGANHLNIAWRRFMISLWASSLSESSGSLNGQSWSRYEAESMEGGTCGFHRVITERALVEKKRFRVRKSKTGTPEPEVSLDTADVVIDG